ncbi:hypothetical protein JOE46_003723 [Rhodococcus sp. PvR099]|nr:hypothetical protein [Rhodococcus sp. PvR099]
MSTSSNASRIGWGTVCLRAAAATAGLTAATTSADSIMTINTPRRWLRGGYRRVHRWDGFPTVLYLPWERVTFRDNGT